MTEPMKPGPTGTYPEGRTSYDDDGELVIAVGCDDGIVFVELGTPVKWFGLPPMQARELAESLIKKAEQAEKEGPSTQ